jgi:hypothetical protein
MTAIRIDTSRLTFPLFLVPGHTSFQDGSTPAGQVVSLVPGRYGFQQISGVLADFTFVVDPAGRVDFAPEFDGFLAGRGTGTLVVRGLPVEVDGTALSHGLLPVVAGASKFLSPDRPHALNLVPATYQFQPASGIVATFAFSLGANGAITVPRAFAGFARADGNRLVLAGCRVTIDGRSLSHDLLPVLGGVPNTFRSRATANVVTYLPGAGYELQPGSGLVADLTFTVTVDGKVDFPADCDGFLAGRGSAVLVVGGYPVVVDATAADSDLVSLANIPVTPATARFLLAVLVPAPAYTPQTEHGVFAHGFRIARDGTVSVAPAVSSSLRVSAVPCVEIIGATPV